VTGLSQKGLKRIEALMLQQWGKPKKKALRSPLDELILSILSQNTNDLNSSRAFLSLRRRFPDWDWVRRAPLSEIEDAIREGGLSQIKAKRIKAILEEIYRQGGELSLDFLKPLSDEGVWAYLCRFKGVGAKTAACVMLFSLGRPVFPVDTHVFRIISRLAGMMGKASPAQIQEKLQKAPSELIYSLHLHLVHHGRQICRPKSPLCEKCNLLPLCAYAKGFGKSRSKRAAKAV